MCKVFLHRHYIFYQKKAEEKKICSGQERGFVQILFKSSLKNIIRDRKTNGEHV